MKENKSRVYVCPEFKRLLKTDAAANGMGIIEYTEKITTEGSIEEIAKGWNKKWKRKDNGGFDFP